MLFGRLATARAELSVLKNYIEKIEHERDQLKSDYRRLVDLIGQAAFIRGTQAKFELDVDPYKEDSKQPDTWLTPGEEEIPAARAIEDVLSPDAN